MIRSQTSAPSRSRPSSSAARAHVEDALVVARQDEGEPAAARRPSPRAARAATADSVHSTCLREQVAHDRLVVGAAAATGRRARG